MTDKSHGRNDSEKATGSGRKEHEQGAAGKQGAGAHAEKLKHGYTSADKTGAPKGRNRANAGEETS